MIQLVLTETVHDQVGRGDFLALYVASGVFGSFVSLSRLVLMRKLLETSLGASGAMTGIIAAWLLINAGEVFLSQIVEQATNCLQGKAQGGVLAR